VQQSLTDIILKFNSSKSIELITNSTQLISYLAKTI